MFAVCVGGIVVCLLLVLLTQCTFVCLLFVLLVLLMCFLLMLMCICMFIVCVVGIVNSHVNSILFGLRAIVAYMTNNNNNNNNNINLFNCNICVYMLNLRIPLLIIFFISPSTNYNNNNNNNNNNIIIKIIIIYYPIIYTSAREAGGAAALAERDKSRKYSHLDRSYLFQPIAVKPVGRWVQIPCASCMILAVDFKFSTGEPQSFTYMLQRLSVAIQLGNTSSVLGTLEQPSLQCID